MRDDTPAWQVRRQHYAAQGVKGLNQLEDALARRLFAVMGMRNPERRIWDVERIAFDATYNDDTMLQRVWRLFSHGLASAGYHQRWQYQAARSHRDALDCFRDGAYTPGVPVILVQDDPGVCMYYDVDRSALPEIAIPFVAIALFPDNRCLVRQQAGVLWRSLEATAACADEDEREAGGDDDTD